MNGDAHSQYFMYPRPDAVPGQSAVNFRRLRLSTLKRYADHHGIGVREDLTAQELAAVVARHFETQYDVLEEDVLLNFCKTLQASTQAPTAVATRAATRSRRERRRKRRRGEDDFVDDDQESLEMAAPAAPAAPAGQMLHEPEEEGDDSVVYCFCNRVSYGEMIACDNPDCDIEWFHMDCVGLPAGFRPEGSWFCPRCRTSKAAVEAAQRKASTSTYGDMIAFALHMLPNKQGTFKEICTTVEREFNDKLNWKLENSSDVRRTPVWKSSVRKILFSNPRFKRLEQDKNCFTLAE